MSSYVQLLVGVIYLTFSTIFFSSVNAAEQRPNILFCIADDWGFGHAGVYGDKVVATPNFDRIAREGMLFRHAFSASPSCTPSRAAILTGQYPHRLEQGGQLHGFLPKKYPNYVDILENSGYEVGLTSKGWGPGRFVEGGYTRNPAGPVFKSFATFLEKAPVDKPFCFWLGSQDPHRPYEKGSGKNAELDAAKVRIPAYWPDNDTSRGDVLDYYFEVQRFDQLLGEAIKELEARGQLENTLIVVTADNGMPFPRCKANLYDGGTRQPLAIRFGSKIKRGQVSEDFVNLMDLAPTFIEVAGLTPPAEMTGRSLLPLLSGKDVLNTRKEVFLERERHANVRAGDVGYPIRAVRTTEFLYIRNFEPERWPAGDPKAHKDPRREFGDVDDGLIKTFILENQNVPEYKHFFELCFGKRPSEELYEIGTDPDNVRNLAADPKYAEIKTQYRDKLQTWMKNTGDERIVEHTSRWDEYPYFGGMRGNNPVKTQ